MNVGLIRIQTSIFCQYDFKFYRYSSKLEAYILLKILASKHYFKIIAIQTYPLESETNLVFGGVPF